jgi:hypothetical protein
MPRIRYLTPLVLVLTVATWTRLSYPGVNAFAFDEARLSLIALSMGRDGQFTTVGMPSSAGTPNMPAAAWLFALPYALSADPLVPTLFVGIVGVLAVGGVWWLARPWGAAAATVAGVVLAAHPFAVLYGRSIWAQNLLIPLAVVWTVAAHHVATTARRRWALGIAAFLSGFGLQVHFAGAALALAGAYAFFRWRWWRDPLPVLMGGGLAVLCALPFALTPGTVAGLLNAAGGDPTVDLAAWHNLTRLLASHDWAYLTHGDTDLPLTRLTRGTLNAGLGVLLGMGIVLAGAFGAAAWLRLPDTRPALSPADNATNTAPALLELALVLLVAAPLTFTYHSTPVFLHYLLPSLPAGALLLGWLAADTRPRLLRNLTLAVALVLAFVWTGSLSRSLAYAGTQHTPNGLPEPLHTLRHVATSTDAKRPVLFFTHGDDPLTQGEPSIFRALWWERGGDARILDGRSLLVLPDDPATLLFTERAFQAWEEARESDLLTDAAQVPRRAGIAPFERVHYDGEALPAGFTLLDAPIPFASGAVLRGWRVYTIGPRTRVSTLWAAPGSLDATTQQFHHLRPEVTTNDTPPIFVSDVSVRGQTWREGDMVIVMADFFDLDPSTAYQLTVGHYTLPDLTRLQTADGRDAVPLGTFTPPPSR